ncbi:MAG: hypothetical protein EOP42_27795 [Sphingobacteriaceae bacterium]|nr:MAG: hypothetical protein EOP42_27795 [Sphingobacteriaceae bacterium]
MKKLSLAFVAFLCLNHLASAQKAAQVKQVLDVEKDFNRVIAQKGVKDGMLSVVEPDALVFKPEPISAITFYNGIGKTADKLTVVPKIARISANGDLAFTAGTYTLKNGTDEGDFGEYLSIWRVDLNKKLKMIFNIDMQHPEPKQTQIPDIKDPVSKPGISGRDPFNGRNIIITTDKLFNSSLALSTLSAYKEFITLDGRFYFPGFEPVVGHP